MRQQQDALPPFVMVNSALIVRLLRCAAVVQALMQMLMQGGVKAALGRGCRAGGAGPGVQGLNTTSTQQH